jgi:hypothetical protein
LKYELGPKFTAWPIIESEFALGILGASSASSSRDNPCYEIDSGVAALNVAADDGRSYLLPYAQFLYAERMANAALEREPEAPPEKLLLHFATADVALLGTGLKAVEKAIQRYELKSVLSVNRRFAATLKTHIAAVSITFTKHTP